MDLKLLEVLMMYSKKCYFLYAPFKGASSSHRLCRWYLTVPYYAKIPGVRAKIREYQRNYVNGKTIIVEGRDIGSVVFPDAKSKYT